MEYIIASVLTFISFLAIIKLIGFYGIKSYKSKINRQSYFHYLSKIVSSDSKPKQVNKVSQIRNRLADNSIKAMVIDDRAYWVLDNTFYFAEAKNGNVDPETTMPIDIHNVPKQELDKLLFILDKLKDDKDK